jgi:hypothetical protein
LLPYRFHQPSTGVIVDPLSTKSPTAHTYTYTYHKQTPQRPPQILHTQLPHTHNHKTLPLPPPPIPFHKTKTTQQTQKKNNNAKTTHVRPRRSGRRARSCRGRGRPPRGWSSGGTRSCSGTRWPTPVRRNDVATPWCRYTRVGVGRVKVGGRWVWVA